MELVEWLSDRMGMCATTKCEACGALHLSWCTCDTPVPVTYNVRAAVLRNEAVRIATDLSRLSSQTFLNSMD